MSPDRRMTLMKPTYEQIEMVARAMFGFENFPNFSDWAAIDQGERNHWLKLAEADLLARDPPYPQSPSDRQQGE